MKRMSLANRGRRLIGWALALPIAALVVVPAAAEAVTVAPGYQVEDWATGFAVNGAGIGPVGVAPFGGKVYVSEFPTGRIYVFDQGAGGVAGTATELTQTPIAGQLAGLTFDGTGRLYGALRGQGAVVELSRADGRILRTVASGLGCVVGIATDPLSGDLFVSRPCGPAGVLRISAFASGPATVAPYSLTDGDTIDGLAFGADGTLYAASETRMMRVAGTDQPGAGATVTTIAPLQHSDGVAVAAGPTPQAAPFLLGVTTTGAIERLDLSTSPATITRVMSGGSRGDLAAVGSDGCLYATQSDRVIRLTRSDGTCRLTPTPPLGPRFVSFDAAGAGSPAAQALEQAVAARTLSILRLAGSARTLTKLRRVKVRALLRGPALAAVRLDLVDLRGRTLARGAVRYLKGTRTISLRRTKLRVRPGLVRLRARGRSASGVTVRLVASKRLSR